MQPTLKAILARFKGNTTKAAVYCSDIAWAYPTLCREYMGLMYTILSDNSPIYSAERKQS